jgi:ABC-2 type transport system permease protein
MNSNHPLAQLTLVRFREFIREPEALFWVFGFPIILAAGVWGSHSATGRRRCCRSPPSRRNWRAAARREAARRARASLADAEAALRNGKVALVAEPGANGAVVYRYDDTNPEGRSARMLADRAVQRAAGRQDPIAASDTPDARARLALHRLPGSRLLGMNLMGSAVWGMAFGIVDARRKKLIKRLMATPMPREYYLLSFALSRLVLLVVEVGVVLGFAVLVFHVPVHGSLIALAVFCVLARCRFAPWDC